MARAVIRGTGLYVPGEAIDNRELRSLAGIDFDVAYLVDGSGHDHIAANAGYQLHYVTR